MNRVPVIALLAAAPGALLLSLSAGSPAEPPAVTPVLPVVITPGDADHAPSDAVVLFDGTDVQLWKHDKDAAAKWKIEDAGDGSKGSRARCLTVAPGSGNLLSTKAFNDCQIHIEFATPVKVEGEGQGRGNSGVYIQGRYEVQVLDSYNNTTYPDGQCGAIYKQHAPLVNACRGPGQWQTYDIVFRAAKFGADGKKTVNARVTVFQNGVLVQDHSEVTGSTGGNISDEGPTPGPIMLQDHGNLTRFRNIWVRPLN
ncbi:MAG: DUF1080 domain-containing protein [Phycisphaerae bacterium]|nr:DUF1080 domain-containing protein [Phycisphaerae bacterium]